MRRVHVISILSLTFIVLLFQNCSSGFQSAGAGISAASSNAPIPSPNPLANPLPTPVPAPVPGAGPVNSAGCATSSGTAAYFPCNLYFNQSVTAAALDPQSANIISALQSNGGWGNSNKFQIDFSIDVYYATAASQQMTVLTADPNWYSPDSDLPSTIAVDPNGGAQGFESSTSRTCDGGDCHYLVMDPLHNQLTEIWGSNVSANTMGNNGYGSIAEWPFFKNWLINFRGDVCTSADAGGLMIAPMLFTAAEVNAGAINHAIRFILPNTRIACMTYVRPSTHTTGGSSCSGWAPSASGVPYGARFRLKASYDTSGLSAGAKVIANALKTYGMILADGGNIALTAQSDQFSTTKYAGVLTAQDLAGLTVADFDVVDSGAHIVAPGFNCVRNP